MILEIYNVSTFIEYYNKAPGDLIIVFVNSCKNKTILVHRHTLERIENFHTTTDISLSLQLDNIDPQSNGYVFIYRLLDKIATLLYRGSYAINIETDDILRICLKRSLELITLKITNLDCFASNYLFENTNFKEEKVMLSLRRVIKSNLNILKSSCLYWSLFRDKYYYDRYLMIHIKEYCPFDVDNDLLHIIMFNKYIINVKEYVNKYKLDISNLIIQYNKDPEIADVIRAKYKPYLKKIYTMKNIFISNTTVLLSPTDGKIKRILSENVMIFNHTVDIKKNCDKHYFNNMFLIRLNPYDNKNIYNSLDGHIKKISQQKICISLGNIFITTIKFASMMVINKKHIKTKHIISLFNFNEHIQLTNNKFSIIKPSKIMVGQGEHIGHFTSSICYCILSTNYMIKTCDDIGYDIECNIKQRDIIAK